MASTSQVEASATGHRTLLVDEMPTRVRRLSDLTTLVLSMLAAIAVMFLAVVAQGTTQAVGRDVTDAASEIVPKLLQIPTAVVASAVVVIVPVSLFVVLGLRRLWVSVAASAIALAIAIAAARFLEWGLDQWASPSLLVGLTTTTKGYVVNVAISSSLCGLAAMLTTAGTRARLSVVRIGWWMLWIDAAFAVLGGRYALTGALVAVLVGRSLGLAMRYLTGGYADRSVEADLIRAIRRSGVDAVEVVRVDPLAAGVRAQAWQVTTSAPLGYTENVREPARPISATTQAAAAATSQPLLALPHDDADNDHLEVAAEVDADAKIAAMQGQYHLLNTEDLYRRYAVRDADGVKHTVVVLDADRHVVGAVRSAWDRFRRQGQSRRPVGSVNEAADRTMLLSHAAHAAGVRTPALTAVARSRDSVMLVYEHVDHARSLQQLDAGELTDELIDDVWHQIRIAHEQGIAHLAISTASILVDGDSKAWLVRWFEGEVGSAELSRRIDLAQTLAMVAGLVGTQRALASAARCLNTNQMSSIAPLLQPVALPATTRRSPANLRTRLRRLREALVDLVPQADVEPVQLTRFSIRSVITVTVFVVAVWTLLTTMNFAEISTAVQHANAWWIAVAFVVGLVSFWGGAVVLAAFTPEKIGVWKATEAHFAAAIVDLVAPAAIGSASINLRFLNRRGVSLQLGAATVALVQISQFVTTVVMLIILALATGSGSSISTIGLPANVLVIFAIVAVIVAVAFAVPWSRRHIVTAVGPTLRQAWPRMTWLFANPSRLAIGIAGNVVMTLSYVAAFAACLAAFGQSLPLLTMAVTYLLSNSAGAMIPSPGGTGPIEAALAAGLSAAGISPAIAVSVVVVYRLITLWARAPLGWIFLQRLQKQGLL